MNIHFMVKKEKNKRTQIIQTALELFSKQGLQQTSMAQISQKSGVAVGTIYLNFKSKDELIEGIFLQIKKEYGMHTYLTKEELKLPFEEQFKLIGQKTYQFYTDYPNYFFFVQMSNFLPIISDKIRQKSETFYQQTIDIIISGITNNYIKEIHPILLYRMVYNSITALIQLKLSDKINVNNEMINQTFTILLKGLK